MNLLSIEILEAVKQTKIAMENLVSMMTIFLNIKYNSNKDVNNKRKGDDDKTGDSKRPSKVNCFNRCHDCKQKFPESPNTSEEE